MVIDHLPSGNQTSLIYHYFPRVSPFYLFLGGGCKKELLGCGDTEKSWDIHWFTSRYTHIKQYQTCTNGVTQKGSWVPNATPLRIPKNHLEKSNKTLGARGTPQRNLSLSITKHSHQSNLQPTNTSGPKDTFRLNIGWMGSWIDRHGHLLEEWEVSLFFRCLTAQPGRNRPSRPSLSSMSMMTMPDGPKLPRSRRHVRWPSCLSIQRGKWWLFTSNKRDVEWEVSRIIPNQLNIYIYNYIY